MTFVLMLQTACNNPYGDKGFVDEGYTPTDNGGSSGSGSVDGDIPDISDISDQSTVMNTSTGAISFVILDTDSTIGCTTSVSASSSNTTLIDSSDITLAGTAPNCTVTLTPKAGQSGTSTITLTVSDEVLSSSDTFTLTVTSPNTAPTISDVSNQTINANNSTSALSFTINDSESSLSCATSVTMSSSNATLINDSDVAFGGTAPNCTATLTPNTNEYGSATITLEVSDGSLTAQDTFNLTVNIIPTLVGGNTIWLDASDSSTIFQDTGCTVASTNSDPVGCWQDKSGNNNHVTASGGDRPTLSSSTIQFSGDAGANTTGNCMDLNSISTAQTIIIVIENAITVLDGAHAVLGFTDFNEFLFLSTNRGYTVSFNGTGSTTGQVAINNGSFSSTGEDVGASNVTSSLQILTMKYTSSLSTWAMIGCMTVTNADKRFRANYDLIEMIVYDNNISSDDLTNILNYLNAKHTVY